MILMAASIFSVTADASELKHETEFIDRGYCGNSKVEWGLTKDGTLMITGV